MLVHSPYEYRYGICTGALRVVNQSVYVVQSSPVRSGRAHLQSTARRCRHTHIPLSLPKTCIVLYCNLLVQVNRCISAREPLSSMAHGARAHTLISHHFSSRLFSSLLVATRNSRVSSASLRCRIRIRNNIIRIIIAAPSHPPSSVNLMHINFILICITINPSTVLLQCECMYLILFVCASLSNFLLHTTTSRPSDFSALHNHRPHVISHSLRSITFLGL
jgi:hypothetical protein